MATTEILQFAGDSGANVLTQAEYAALTSILTDGFPAGQILPSTHLNKVLRQAMFMAAGIAGWLAENGVDVPDDGDLAALIANLGDTIAAPRGIAVYTSPGAFSWTVPERVTAAQYILIGGGGGGGAITSPSSSGVPYGGGAGGYVAGTMTVSPGGSVSGSVGAGGSGGVQNSPDPYVAATAGGNTTFGGLTAGGGGAGAVDSVGSPPLNGGSASGGNINIPGQRGGMAFKNEFSSIVYYVGGDGGSTPLGTGGRGEYGAFTGEAGRGYGSGGASSIAAANGDGGAGAPGIVIIRW